MTCFQPNKMDVPKTHKGERVTFLKAKRSIRTKNNGKKYVTDVD